MQLKNKRIVLGITSSFYAIEKIITQINKIIQEGAEIIPVASFDVYNNKAKCEKNLIEIEKITGKEIVHTIEGAELIDYKKDCDIMLIIPCSSNTIAKLANGIVDTPVLVTAKTILKNGKDIIIGIATNEGLSLEAENIGKLLKQKNVYFIPFRQNNPITKPNSLLFSSIYINETIEKTLDGEQIQPILL